VTWLAFQVLLNTISQYFNNCLWLRTKIEIDFEPRRLVLQWFPPLPVGYAQLKNQQHSFTLITYYPQLKSGKVFMSFLNDGSHASSWEKELILMYNKET